MKKKFSTAETVRAALVSLAALVLLTGCAFTEQGNRIKDERNALETLERKRGDYEVRYIMVLNSLERYVGDVKLERERDAIRKKILEINTRIQEQRQTFEVSLQDWETKLAQEKLQNEMDKKTERSNLFKRDGEWDNSR